MISKILQGECSIKQASFVMNKQNTWQIMSSKQNRQRASYSVVRIALELDHVFQ